MISSELVYCVLIIRTGIQQSGAVLHELQEIVSWWPLSWDRTNIRGCVCKYLILLAQPFVEL